MRARTAAAVALAALAGASAIWAQGPDLFVDSPDHPAIRYSTAPAKNPVADLNRRIADGSFTLAYDSTSGYLRSLLDGLKIAVDSQVLVFSQTSFQFRRIDPKNPRALYFSDSTAVGWVRGGDLLEVATLDATLGTV